MREDEAGYLRPVRESPGRQPADANERFREACPGVSISANDEHGTRPHPTMGAYVEVWMAWSTDPEFRQRGSSGGVLSALSAWSVDSGRSDRAVGATSAPDPRRSVSVTIMSRADALAAAGSRYTPVAILENPDVFDPQSIVTCKPCEASALRGLDADRPLVLSFFCAGTPSARATDRLLGKLGLPAERSIDELWYRGHGWPGRFTARSGTDTISADYDESWGATLGPTTQWRCKICPDGVGESADIVASDYWNIDARGYPVFIEGDGVSALIARTARGRQAILDAKAAGVIVLKPIEMDSLAAVQPFQVERRRSLAARMIGSRLAGRRPPTFRGFHLTRLSLERPRHALRVIKGTFDRVRRAGAR